MASQKGLGRGLGALLGDFSEETNEKSAYQMLPIYRVEPNPDQPRQDFDEEELQAHSAPDCPGDCFRLLSDHRGRAPLAGRKTGRSFRCARCHHGSR